MDFYQIKTKKIKKSKNGLEDVIEIYPDYKVCRTKDLMVRGKSFYAIWDDKAGMWSTNEYDVQRLVDEDLDNFAKTISDDCKVSIRYLSDFSSNSWKEFRKYLNNISDNYHVLDNNVIFANTDVKKTDYASKKLPYALENSSIDAYEELMNTLYDAEERQKIEWAIGSIIAGDSKKIQKFIVLFGEAGTGKSTVLNIIQKLFEGYYTIFESKALTTSSNIFATEAFKSNSLVAVEHDGDLSKIEDNTRLNSIISHEEIIINEKYKATYMGRANCFLFMATNKPVKITDGKSGILRRLIDVKPTGKKVSAKKYNTLIEAINFELGSIAQHCLDVYLDMGKNYYNGYRPVDMQLQTDTFYNFVEENYYVFEQSEGVTLKAAYSAYKEYCDEALIQYKLPMYKFREELKNYFGNFEERAIVDGKRVRSYYTNFISSKFYNYNDEKDTISEDANVINFEDQPSIFDKEYSNMPAQLATANETPKKKWADIHTILSDIDTKKLHYVKVPENHIVIDFDIKDEKGKKSFEKNLEAASVWPKTYSELSKSGNGIHLHYIYDGDVSELSRLYDENIEVKVFTGNSALRRKLTKCNNIPIMHISSGLPLQEKRKNMVNFDSIKNEKALRTLISKSLNKEYPPHATKTSVDFIFKVLDEAYSNGTHYDVRDLRPKILAFANNSTHNSEYCLSLVSKMKFSSDDISENTSIFKSDEIVFYDVEVFENLFVVVYKMADKKPIQLINPTSVEIEDLLKYKLVGFNCRRYDNHILYAKLIGYSNQELFKLSQRIINGSKNCMFGPAYNLSYADVLDFSSKKQSLKKFEIELGIHHQELGLPWDKPVDESLWQTVADYCINDVVATEAVFKAREQDFIARKILSDISGLSVNDTTQQHTAKIIFGTDPHPQDKFIYTDLSEMFEGYSFDKGHSTYKGEDPGEGGYVYAEPGMYTDVALLDVESMHPNSLIQLNLFGVYTSNFKQLLDARLAIKHKDYISAKKMMNGVLEPYLQSEEQAEALSYALKIVINSVYGLTSAKFDCKFKDPRNIDNIVAKRGALFMIDLKHEVQKRGFTVAHIKTDSIKIPNATKDIIEFVKDFGKKYGYNFDHEATYSKMCLVNDSAYIAKVESGKHAGEWSATGAQFAQPYVFKTLFSKEKLDFEDFCETKTVTSALYLDMNEGLKEDEHNYHFVGKAGLFTPILPGKGGGILLRDNKDGKYSAAVGTKGYRWMESEMVKNLHKEKDIDESYYKKLVDDSVKTISKFGDFEWFISE